MRYDVTVLDLLPIFLNLGRGDVGEEAADLGPVLELDVEVGGLVVVLGLRTGGMGLCSGTHS